MDTASLIKETYKEIVGIDTIEGTNFAAIFGHLVGMFIVQISLMHSHLKPSLGWIWCPILWVPLEWSLQSRYVCYQVLKVISTLLIHDLFHFFYQIRKGGSPKSLNWIGLQESHLEARFTKSLSKFPLTLTWILWRWFPGWERSVEEFPGPRAQPGGIPQEQGPCHLVLN